ncbi:MAG: hypothetical protein J6Y92_06510 [Lentisphaeria bacterium]|nr:hypothetical protein [Lentisphaeria bacterium]
MKKKYECLIWGGGFVLLAVLALSVYVFISGRSREPVFDPAPLIGLTKEEVLGLAFDQYRKSGAELEIRVPAIRAQVIRGERHLSMMDCSYKTIGDAKKDDYLMSSDIWETNERKKFSLSMIQKPREVYVFYFENGKVSKVKTKIFYRE